MSILIAHMTALELPAVLIALAVGFAAGLVSVRFWASKTKR